MFEDYLRAVPKNPLLKGAGDLGDLGAGSVSTGSRPPGSGLLTVSSGGIRLDLQDLLLIDSPVLDRPAGAADLERLLAQLKQMTESQQYRTGLDLLRSARGVTGARNAAAVALLDSTLDLVVRSGIGSRAGLALGHLLAAGKAGLPIDQYLESNRIDLDPDTRSLLDLARREMAAAPPGTPLQDIVAGILSQAGQAAGTPFAPEDLAARSAAICRELQGIQAGEDQARQATQGAVDQAEETRAAAEDDRRDARKNLDGAQADQAAAREALDALRTEGSLLETCKGNVDAACAAAREKEAAAQAGLDTAQNDLAQARSAAGQAAAAEETARKALEDFDAGNPAPLSGDLLRERGELATALDSASAAAETAAARAGDCAARLRQAEVAWTDARADTATLRDEAAKAAAALQDNAAAVSGAEAALASAEARVRAAEGALARSGQALSDAELALLAATTAQADAVGAALVKAFGEYVDACVAMGNVEAERRRGEKRVEKQNEEKKELSRYIAERFRKLDLRLRTSPELLADALLALLDHQTEFLDMMDRTEAERREIRRDVHHEEKV